MIAHAAPSKIQKRDVVSMKDLIKAECISARAQSDDDCEDDALTQNGDNCDDDSMDETLAQFFVKMLEEKAKIEGDEAADMISESKGFRSAIGRIRNIISKAKSKISPKVRERVKNLFEKVKSKIPSKIKEKAKMLFGRVKSKFGPQLDKVKMLLDKVESKIPTKLRNKVKSLINRLG